MVKLLALGPERQDQLAQITGWGEGETLEILGALRAAGRVRCAASTTVAGGHRMWYVPGCGDAAIRQIERDRAARKAREARGAAGRAVANTRRKAPTRGDPLV
jgi:hypothetical protein